LKLAISTDWLTSYGGAERVVEEILGMYPTATVFASVYHAPAVSARLRAADIRTTWLQRLPLVRHYSRALLPAMPQAFSSLDLGAFDLVVSVTTAFAKHLSPGPSTRHICYCNTPPRYLWDLREQYLDRPGGFLLHGIAARLRDADRRSADRVERFIANSKNVATRIRSAYDRDSIVIYPPVRTDLFGPVADPTRDFYLVVSRLVRYKRIDLAVQACSKMGRRLIVIGDGPERERLERLAGPAVEFLGRRSDADIAMHYANCRALLFPGLEDFGITPVEAQAAGRPVVAFARGGALETVIANETGVFFTDQTVDALVEALEDLEARGFSAARCRDNALRFDSSVFRNRLGQALEGSTG
jgi:glycosyltransferase involved in cell wall biosynthesis